jgi:mRNA interferase RelE/StbE
VYKLSLHKRVVKFIQSRNPRERQRIKAKLLKLRENPYPVNSEIDSKQLKNHQMAYRLRVGNYRFLYEIIENELIIYIGYADNRGDIY